MQKTLCEHDGCTEEGFECVLRHDNGEDINYYCVPHAKQHGYCWSCGEFWAGVDSFDFNPNGLCSNCKDEYEEPDDDEDFGFVDPHDYLDFSPEGLVIEP